MLCENLHQIHQVFRRYEFSPSSSDLIQVVCGNCPNTDVCPAGDAWESPPSEEDGTATESTD